MAFEITAGESADWSGYVIDGVKYARVTSIINVLPKPGLARWREKLIREGQNPDTISREAAGHGTRLHKLTERLDRGEVFECPPEYMLHLAAYARWKLEHVKRFDAIEQRVVHTGEGYAGTLDRIAVLQNEQRVLLDLKTGGSVDGGYRLQLSGYQDALADMGDTQIDGRCVVHLPWREPGYIDHWVYDHDERDLAAWRATLEVYRFSEAVKNEWKEHSGGADERAT